MTINPLGVPDEWDDNHIIMFEEFCAFIRTPQRTVREWRRLKRGPRCGASTGTAGCTRPSPSCGASSKPASEMALTEGRSSDRSAVAEHPRRRIVGELVSVKTIRRRIAAGDLRAYRCGKSNQGQDRRPGGDDVAGAVGEGLVIGDR